MMVTSSYFDVWVKEDERMRNGFKNRQRVETEKKER